MKSNVEFISAVLITTPDLARSVDFYRGILGIPLEPASHEDEGPHAETEIGDVHFAIFEKEGETSVDIDVTARLVPSVRIALAVSSLDAALLRCNEANVPVLGPVEDRGFAKLAAIQDPDGNIVDLTELSSTWLEYLAQLRANRSDVVTEYMLRKK